MAHYLAYMTQFCKLKSAQKQTNKYRYNYSDTKDTVLKWTICEIKQYDWRNCCSHDQRAILVVITFHI